MSTQLAALIFAALGTFLGAGIQYFFQRHSAARQERREIIEVHLLQLQNAAESLFYRMNNLLDGGGRGVMKDEYFRTTSLYIIGKVLAQEALLGSQGIYAKLSYNEKFKKQLKANLHDLNRSMDDQQFLHYYRVQLAEMLLRGKEIISYTEFCSIVDDERFREATNAAETFVSTESSPYHERLRDRAREVVSLLEAKTQVPSALSLSSATSGIRDRVRAERA